MSDATIGPALTPEEWAHKAYEGQTVSPWAPSASRHALAALALHGQPFGFTADDVALLRGMSDDHAAGYRLHRDGARDAAALASLAVRIAALLPP